jgi:uncharacterized membrane protein
MAITPGSFQTPKPADVQPVKEKENFFTWLRNKLFTGLFVAFPAIITIWVLQIIYNLVNSVCDPLVRELVSRHREFIPEWMVHQVYIGNIVEETIPGAGMVMTLILLLILGVLATNFLGKRAVRITDNFLLRVPVISTVYNLSKQIVEAFQRMTQPGGFADKQVVYIPYPGLKGYVIGFLTGRFTNAAGEKMGVVFVPTAPNPISGFMLVFKETEIFISDLKMNEAWKMIVSAGLVSPQQVDQVISPIPTNLSSLRPESGDTKQKV